MTTTTRHLSARRVSTVVALVATLALALVPAVVADPAQPGTVELTPGHVGAANPGFVAGDCGLDPTGPYAWHFVLNGLDPGTSPASLSVRFEQSESATASGKPVGAGGTQHFYVYTDRSDVLSGATAMVPGQAGDANLLLGDVASGCRAPVRFGLFRPFGRSATANLPLQPLDMQAIQQRQEELGRRIDIVHTYGVFAAPPNLGDLEVIAANGSDPLLSVLTAPTTGSYRQTVAGALDGSIAAWAEVLSAFAAARPAQKVFLRLDFEFNGPYNGWSPCRKNLAQPQLDTTPQDFVAAWRYVHDKFTELASPAAAANLQWVWSIVDVNPTKDPSPCRLDIAAFYPGDAYVDVLSMDVYDELASDGSFRETVQASYDALASLPNSDGSLPISISEMATGEAYGALAPPEPYRAEWISGINQALLEWFPRIDSIVWFDVVKERLHAIDGCNYPNLPTTDAVPPPVSLVTDPNTPKLPQNWRTWGGLPFGYTCPGPDAAALGAARDMLANPPFIATPSD